MVEPQTMFDFVFGAFQDEEMSIDECNQVGMNMPDGYQFHFLEEDEL